ncbi:alpha-crystallin B chain-like [Agrilus planipennis]|uniref:Alpha-crystallin B chain-like n=1 Tax=Agrilus planipennis TaxID=224129 RepID=A0A1W4WK18_AGRPL|nr:alpha-crystallin B chain-like [Agrilus planipennis]
MSLIPWHTSGPSRALLDPYFGLRLNEKFLDPVTLPPWETRAPWHERSRRPSPLIPWHTSGPSRALDPYFGLRLGHETFLDPLTIAPWERSYSWDTPPHTDAASTIKEDKDKFEVNVDVQHFLPDEIKVTSSGNTLTVEGKHEEKPDEHGSISRHFVRKYVLPEDHDLNHLQSHISSDGVLTITAPKIPADGNMPRAIPVQHTGKPKKAIKHK